MEVKTFTRVTKTEEREHVLRLPDKTDIIPSAIMFMLGRASIAGMYPFACAYFAASFDKRTAYIGVLALLSGVITSGEGLGGVRYVFAAVVYWLYSYIRDERKNTTMSAVVCACGVFICGGMFLPYTNPSVYGIIQLFAESMLTGFLFVAFKRAGLLVRGRETRTQIGHEEIICLAICIGGTIKGFSGIAIPGGFEITRVLTMYAVTVLSLYASMGTAVVGTVLIGICTSADNANALYLVGLYSLCGIFASMLKCFGKYGTLLGFFGGGVMGLLFTGNVFDFPVNLSELIAAGIAFLITPKKVLHEMGSFLTRTFQTEVLRTDLRVKGYLCERLDKISDTFKKLETSFCEFTEKCSVKDIETADGLIDMVAENVCKTCGMCHQCWQTGFNDTYNRMNSLFDVIEMKGYCDRTNAPERLAKTCVRLDSLLDEFTRVYELYKNREIWYNENKRARNLVIKQYGEMSEVLNSLSYDIRNGFSFIDELEDRLIEELDRSGFRVREVSVIENGTGTVEVFVKTVFGTNIRALSRLISEVVEMPMEMRGMENGVCRFTSKCMYSIEVGTFQHPKSGEKQCGDSVVHFRTDDDRYCVVICDGMGSGTSAQEESRFSVDMLSEFLKSGISEQTAVDIINSTLTLKSAKESFSTIDIFVFDLQSGNCKFMKIGGAESFIKSDNEVETLFSRTLPAGIFQDINTQTYSRNLKNGDMVIMASDGVTESGKMSDSAWIKDMIDTNSDIDILAEDIVKKAVGKSGGKYLDDMTVAAIRIRKTA